MTYKELIKQEIERLYKHYLDAQEFDSGYNMALDDILEFIDSLPEEPASEDLKEEISKWRNHYISVLDNNLRIDLRDIEVTANHFAEWQKQQMMKDAVEGEICGKWRNQEYEIDNSKFRIGDKVKIIICSNE